MLANCASLSFVSVRSCTVHACMPTSPCKVTQVLGKRGTHHVFCMSIIGDTCSPLGTCVPPGLNRNVTRSPHGVFVTSAMHTCSTQAEE